MNTLEIRPLSEAEVDAVNGGTSTGRKRKGLSVAQVKLLVDLLNKRRISKK